MTLPHTPAVQPRRLVAVGPAARGGLGPDPGRLRRGGRVGLVLRRGEALMVERSGGRSFVVTVDDAATAAALLNTMAERARTR
ncbi:MULTISPECIES: hypothetical protein [unclassified Nocardiopsis]|uniref:hypothetical protein n=1 Tax=Nocardiopsis TaxID=2013 RepID=UPI00387B8BAB